MEMALRHMDKRSCFQTLPKPKGTFLLGNTAAFGQDPLGFLTHCSQTYGEIVRFTLNR